MIDTLEEFMFNKMNIKLNIIQILHFTICIGMNILKQVVKSIIDVEFRNDDTEQKISDWNSEMPTLHGFARKSKIAQMRDKIFVSKVVLASYAANISREIGLLGENLPLDTECYNFAIDTCTTYHICKHEELFVGKIQACQDIFIQGVGGKTRVSGCGTIKIRIADNDGRKHDLIINDVLFVPECPTNLISPQEWSRDTSDPSGTGKITIGGSTLLF